MKSCTHSGCASKPDPKLSTLPMWHLAICQQPCVAKQRMALICAHAQGQTYYRCSVSTAVLSGTPRCDRHGAEVHAVTLVELVGEFGRALKPCSRMCDMAMTSPQSYENVPEAVTAPASSSRPCAPSTDTAEVSPPPPPPLHALSATAWSAFSLPISALCAKFSSRRSAISASIPLPSFSSATLMAADAQAEAVSAGGVSQPNPRSVATSTSLPWQHKRRCLTWCSLSDMSAVTKTRTG